MKILSLLMVILGAICIGGGEQLGDLIVTERMHHLRIDGEREWSEFAENPEAEQLILAFVSEENHSDWSLRLRQYDVKQHWLVTVNDTELGRLITDENDMVLYFPVPTGTLRNGSNVIRIMQVERLPIKPDDIKVGEIMLMRKSMMEALSDGEVEIEVLDSASKQLIPSRVTIMDENGVLQTTAAVSNAHLAVRPGTIYTSTGKLRFALPAGKYTIFAGRGFEYSLARKEVLVTLGSNESLHMQIRREVPTEGYVSSDTHIHTLTHSGHGDATVEERMITLAGEGIELPIATDHNKHIDHKVFAEKANVLAYFTPVIGNEVTTSLGHFNIYPVQEQTPIPDYKLEDWKSIFADVYRTPGVRVAILNHPRDIHSGITPFGPALFNDVVGENLEGWAMNFNAMEVINSGATQTDVLQLFRDWMALLNRGYQVTPIGSSDSHDVSRHFVGQGRTYIRCDDRDPANIDISAATNGIVQGQVMVSYGLLAEMSVAGKYQSGDMVRMPDDMVEISIRVLGPHWTSASTLQLYANGQLIRTVDIASDSLVQVPIGVKWEGNLQIEKPNHDVHLVAIALGPGIDKSYWKTAKPYQPASAEWYAKVVGCSGAIWLDVDGDGRKTSAYEYATRAFSKSGGNLSELLTSLFDYDEAVAAQAANLWQKSGGDWDEEMERILQSASESTRNGFMAFKKAFDENQKHR